MTKRARLEKLHFGADTSRSALASEAGRNAATELLLLSAGAGAAAVAAGAMVRVGPDS